MTRLRLAAVLFCLCLAGLPLVQGALELGRGQRLQVLDVWGPVREVDLAERGRRLSAFEEDLRKASFVRTEAVPWYQLALSVVFGRGNEKAVEGRDGYLYYADDLDLAAGPGILRPGGGAGAALDVIERFRDALAQRGIQLLVVPIPIKGMVDAEHLQVPRPLPGHDAPRNPDHEAFFQALDARGIEHLRLLPDMLQRARTQGGLFLPRDTHWRPREMQRAAERIAARVRALLGEESHAGRTYELRSEHVEGQGDLVRMLRFPPGRSAWPPMELDVERVLERKSGQAVQPDPESDVLLLGDSFTRVFSDPELGLGQSAGLGEHLAYQLDRPVDVIALLGGSATAVRESLARRRGGLDGKRIVVWEMGMRLLAEGPESWRDVPLPPPGESPGASSGEPAAGASAGPAGGQALRVVAEITEASRIPEDFDYDFCLVIHELRVRQLLEGQLADETLWVAFPGMVDYALTEPAELEVGTVLRLRLEPLEQHYDLESTPWADDTDAGRTIWWAAEWSRVKQ